MTEPVHEVNVGQLLTLIGEQQVEIRITRAKLAQAEARIKELSAPDPTQREPQTGPKLEAVP